MQLRRRLFATVAIGASGALLGLAAPAGAATTGATTTTFTLTAGVLAITAPASTNLGSAATGTSSLTAALGSVTITDGRGALLGSWTGSVSSSDFTTGAATANETITKANASYWSGAATATTGVGTFTAGQANAGAAQALGTSKTAYSATSVIGNNTVAWNPTLIVSIPSAAVAGTYSGTVTHSVA